MAAEQLNYNEELVGKVTQDLENICYEFKTLVDKYPGIIEGIRESGWKGESNSNFIGKSEEYIANLETILNSLDSFSKNFAARVHSAQQALL